MSLIEQAAKRLEQLRQAGVQIPETTSALRPAREEEAPAAQPRMPAPEADRSAFVETAPSPSPAGRQPAAGSGKYVEIDLVKLQSAGFLTPLSPRSQLADEFRVIKRPLISNAVGKGAELVSQGNLIMVTSAVPGEGKTFTSINLAISMAMELDTTVLLVDADVAKPSVLNTLGLQPSPGLLDVVSKDSLDISGMILKTNIDKLSILPSGTQHPRATELLASDSMVRLLDDMGNRYSDRIIIFDSPPLLMTTESRELATHMGQIVLVVGAERTMHAQVKQALAMIDSCPVKMLTLNRARPGPLDHYGYGYGYGYGHGYPQGAGLDTDAPAASRQ
ncbi:MAG: XrtA-associated tyrosine autokinase [Pseudomonadota bacterium]